ncbi:MAG: hypothetical protein E7619_09735 [Ruminococcaceae bacterium]|nr:hypothetical protein [Oscillospiraceae bacterium]
MWSNCFRASLLLLAVFSLAAIIMKLVKYKTGRIVTPFKLLFAGVALSAVVLFIPIYRVSMETTDCGAFERFFICIHNMIRLFLVDGEFAFIETNLVDVPEELYRAYTSYFAVLFVLAPLLTFGFVLSFFKNASAYCKYLFVPKRGVYVFSELNDKSLALANSLAKTNKHKRLFVFTDVFEQDEEHSFELVEKAKEIKAICFKKDIITINFRFRFVFGTVLNFFTIGADESENINQAIKLIEKLKFRKNTNLYVCSTQVEAELLLAKAFNSCKEDGSDDDSIKIKVRRVNEVQALVARTLYNEGHEKIYGSAQEDGSGVKKINAVIIGMGQHGTEMTKALSWFCQMDGYQVEINAFDLDENADIKFKSLCPELMSDEYNGRFDVPDDAKYKISVHPKIDVNTSTFDNAIMALPRTTYAFVALGNDEKNIATAVKLRTMFERLGYDPVIQAIVYNSDKKKALADATNFKGQKFRIDFIGDMESSYSEEVILDSDVEEAALKRHLKWGKESEFWQYDYNYKSSVASAIHRRVKELCKVPGIEKEPAARTDEERRAIRVIEHSRWNAYMRSEGYVYGGTTDKSGRNDLAKTHNCLVAFKKLPQKEQEKDDD